MADISTLVIKITPEGIDAAARDLKNLEAQGKRTEFAAAGVSSAFGALKTAIAAVGIAAAMRQYVHATDALGKLSARTGESVENLSRLQYAAELNDVTNDQLANSLQRLAKSMSDTAAGSGESRAAFAAMGVSVADAAGKLRSSGDVLRDIADKFAGYQDSASKAALAQRIFGESGANLIPLLNQGRQGLAELADESDRFGRTISTEAARASEEFSDNLTRLSSIMLGLRNEIGNALIPTLADLSREFLDARAAGLTFMEALVGIGLSDPTKGAADHIARLTGEIDKLQKAQEQPWYFRSLFENLGGQERIALLGKELDYWKRQLLAIPPLDPRDRMAGAGEPRISAPTLPKSTTAGTTRRTPRATREDLNAGFDIAAAEAYAHAWQSINAMQIEGEKSTLDLNSAQSALYDLMRSSEWSRMSEPWQQVVITQTASATSAIDAANAQRRLNELLAATPTAQLEAQRQTMLMLAKAFDDGKVSVEQFAEASTVYLGNELPALAQSSSDAFMSLQSSIEGWGRDSANALVEFAMTGKTSFADMVNSMLADLARMAMYKLIFAPLTGGLSALFMHSGGIVGSGEGSGSRSVSSSTFTGAIRYHSGGLAGDEVPTILQRGEGVFTRGQMKALGAGMSGTNVSVEIINNTGAPVQQREAAYGRGGRKMTIVIGDAVAGELRRPGSSAYSAARQTFGLTPTLAGR